ncbi:hypothetical protein [Bradyrhizobium sp. USDA 4529]
MLLCTRGGTAHPIYGRFSEVTAGSQRLSLGCYTLDPNAEAYVNGNKLFSATRLSLVAPAPVNPGQLPVFLNKCPSLRAQTPSCSICTASTDLWTASRIFASLAQLISRLAKAYRMVYFNSLFWLMSYEAMFVDRTDQNAPNQAMLMSRAIVDAKTAFLTAEGHKDVLANFTIDSPVPTLDLSDRTNGMPYQPCCSHHIPRAPVDY